MKIASTKRSFASRGGQVDAFAAVLGLTLLLSIFGLSSALYYWRSKQAVESAELIRITKERQATEEVRLAELEKEEQAAKVAKLARLAEIARIEAEKVDRINAEKAEEARVLRELELAKRKTEVAYAERKKAEAVEAAFRAYSDYCANKAIAKEQEQRLAAEKDRLLEEDWARRAGQELEGNGWRRVDSQPSSGQVSSEKIKELKVERKD